MANGRPSFASLPLPTVPYPDPLSQFVSPLFSLSSSLFFPCFALSSPFSFRRNTPVTRPLSFEPGRQSREPGAYSVDLHADLISVDAQAPNPLKRTHPAKGVRLSSFPLLLLPLRGRRDLREARIRLPKLAIWDSYPWNLGRVRRSQREGWIWKILKFGFPYFHGLVEFNLALIVKVTIN